jgi:lycopene beta-cyclase
VTEEVFDGIIVGLGVAGSRLLTHLLAGPWRTRRILVIERTPGRGSDHALAWWTDGPCALDPLVEQSWTALRVVAANGAEDVRQLREHRYVMTRRAAITVAAADALRTCPNVQVLAGAAVAIVDGPETAAVRVDDRWYRGRWVFDSRRPAPGPATVRLVQRFTGWTIEAKAPRFDPTVATLFDFRTAQPGAACFVYVLPFSSGGALVEHVFVGHEGAPSPEPEDALRSYLETRLGLREGEYTVVSREQGSSPLSDACHPRREGRRVCAIGLRGGRLKPSSGYALARIERDSAAIARSLARWGHPFRVPRDGWLYRSLDAIFLWVLAREPTRVPAIFSALLRRPDNTLRFLDERAGVVHLALLLLTLPTWVFLRATLRWLCARRRRVPHAPPLKTGA